MRDEPHKTLGRNVVPSHYKLRIEPNLRAFRFSGHVEIDVTVAKPTKAIRLNAKELTIRRAAALAAGDTYRVRARANKKDETVTLSFSRPVRGAATIAIDFAGRNNDRLYGFYRSKYINNGKAGYILTTQFEATDARSAFPCFDEPEFKATFDVELVVDKALDAISNMPVKATSDVVRGRKSVTFATTPAMSTYLVYLGVGRFEYLRGSLGKLQIRIVTVPGKARYTKMALDFTKRFVRYFEDYFGIEYPLPKLDMIAVPDFSSGAMENWGALTFRELVLLGDPKVASVAERRRIAEVIAHELAHQWFGDLVTMKWWNDLWLNESFATFMAAKAVDSVFPKWQFGMQYFIDTVGEAFAVDQLRNSHPISVRVNEPHEIGEIFDKISYDKGGSVLQMLEDYAGAYAFRKGLNIYLSMHAYGNADKYDLWNAIQRAATRHGEHVDAVEVASHWIDNAGYPIVKVKPLGGKAVLSQKRFLLLGSRPGAWPIPLHYMTERRRGFVLMKKRKETIRFGRSRYIKLNYAQRGLYRVMYPRPMLDELGILVRTKRLGPLDAWGIENDLYELARSCRIKLAQYLGFIQDYCLDGGFPLNLSVSQHLDDLCIMLYGTRVYERVRGINLMHHRRMLKRLGWKTRKADDDITIMLRSAAIMSLGIVDDEDTLRRARSIFAKHLRRGAQIDVNLRGAVYALSAMSGGASMFSQIMRLYKRAQLPEEQRRLLRALGSFTDKRLLKKALKFSLSKGVRLQDAFMIPTYATMTRAGKDIIWGWTRGVWPRLLSRFRTASPKGFLDHYIENLDVLADERHRREVERFFSKKRNMKKGLERTLAERLEMIEANARFVEAQRGA